MTRMMLTNWHKPAIYPLVPRIRSFQCVLFGLGLLGFGQMTSTTPSRPLSTSSSFVLFGLIIARLVVAMVTINKNSYWKAGDGIKRKTLNWAPGSLKWDMEQLREKFEAVKASGDLIFFPSQIVNIQDKDIQVTINHGSTLLILTCL